MERMDRLDDSMVATCVIVEAELRFMAYRSDRAEENMVAVTQFLAGMAVHPIVSGAADQYARLKTAILTRFGPRERAAQRHITIERLGFSENDLWIAAIARRFGLTIVSADADFIRMAQAVPISVEDWTRPAPGIP